MAQDIRELLRQDKKMPSEQIREGHQHRFLAKLEQEFPEQEVQKKRFDYSWLRVAASIVVIVSVSLVAFNQFSSSGSNNLVSSGDEVEPKEFRVVMPKQSSLAEMSPEYKEAENYLLTSINFELSQITEDDTNKDLVDSFKVRLKKLDDEYQNLNKELEEIGPNSSSVEAMIENLKLRLDLLLKLKEKLKELEKIANEGYHEIQV